MKNNKGMTLIELLITLVFVGIILVFMFSILNGLRNETNNNNFAYNNQTNKVDAIHAIQKDLNTYVLLGIEDKSNNNVIIYFHYLKGDEKVDAILSSSINGNKNYFNYKNVNGLDNKWEMKDAKIDTCGKFTIYNEGIVEETENNSLVGGNYKRNNYYFKLNFNLYNKNYHEQNNNNKNNFVDDIEITYSGYNDFLESNSSYLTSKVNGTYNIGKC